MAKISKKQAKDKIDQFESIDEFKEENLANKRAKVIFVGVKNDKDMTDNGFSKKQLEQLQGLLQPIHNDINELKKDMKDVKSRLDVLEQDMKEVKKDIKDMKSTSTMSKELNLLNKK